MNCPLRSQKILLVWPWGVYIFDLDGNRPLTVLREFLSGHFILEPPHQEFAMISRCRLPVMLFLLCILCFQTVLAAQTKARPEMEGFVPIFDGRTLEGWR